ncbi:MAG: hypothetical protein KAV45_12600 [Calditrichia bacterium]|nr:hypothetical protein [Calditrichia bacterium]
MAQKKRDFGLILSLGLIIAIASYWFVKEMPMDGVEHYVDLLGDKLMALIPEEKDKQEMAAIYDDFKTKVKEKKISPENVEQVASAIINLSIASDSLTLSEAEALIRIAFNEVPVDGYGLIHVPEVEATPEEWEELNERLSSVYQLEEQLKDHVIIAPETPMPQYRVDEKLNIIIDTRVKADLKREELLKKFEEEEHVFWKDSVAENMEKDLQKLEVELRALSEDMEIQHNLLKLKVLTHPVGEDVLIMIDSLDLITIVNWDSIEGEVAIKIEEFKVKRSTGAAVGPKDKP